MKQIYLDAPNLGPIEKKYLNNCIDSGFVSTVGQNVIEFENKISNFCGTKRAVSVQSGTAGIHMSLYELGIKPGDEVIVPAMTFIASVNPIIYLGAKPVFVDVDEKTWNISTDELETVITKNTKAIIPVHLYGNPCNMNKLLDISNKFDIPLVEDAAESLGAKYNNKMTGSFGKFGVFSFNGNKVITTGGGGMITTDNDNSADHIKFLINQGKDEKKGYYHPEIGFNYRMTNLEASLGLAQLERLPEFLKIKKEIYELYKKELSNVNGIIFQKEYSNSESSWWLISIIIDSKISLQDIQKKMTEQGIQTRRLFMPILEHPPYSKYKISSYNNAYDIYNSGLNLPSSTLNKKEDIKFVSDTLKSILEG